MNYESSSYAADSIGQPTHRKLSFLLLIFIASCSSPKEIPKISDEDISNENETADWLAYGRTHSETRFSPLADINVDTVSGLGIEWYLDLPDKGGLTATPLVVDGILYFPGTMNVIRAVDARTGQLLWSYDPDVAGELARHRQAGRGHSRGLSFYGNKLFAATWDGRLIALDAKSGELIWSTRTFGADMPMYITGAPKAFKGKVVIGNGGTENGPARGYVTAYDADTGKQVWRFYVVPGDPAVGFENDAMEMAAKTWTGRWWEHGGGGNAWHGLTYDPEFDALYIGTGNGSPWNRQVRSPEGGDNLFLSSIVALDPDTGTYRWHYQTTPGESWDYNSSMDMVLADLVIEERNRKVLLHAPKNGFFYVLDRETGRLISAEPFVETSWASHIDIKTGRPVEMEGARYESAPMVITPSPLGAHSWHAMSFNPDTGLVYLPTIHHAVNFDGRGFNTQWRSQPFWGGIAVSLSDDVDQPRSYPGSLQAWDPVRQVSVWSVPQQHLWNAGTLATAGQLVFQGRADGIMYAYDAQNGAIVWEYDLGLGISAPPITYKLDGVQYLAVLLGYGGSAAANPGSFDWNQGWEYGIHTRRLVAFAIDGKSKMPPQPPPHFVEPMADKDIAINEALASTGETKYRAKCAWCHGTNVIAAGMAPDLRASAAPLHKELFDAIVRDGAYAERGMPQFSDLQGSDLDEIRHYIRSQAQ